MQAQLEDVAQQFRAAQRRLHRLAADLPDELWSTRTAPGRWSASECVEHLNTTAERFLPPMRAAIEKGRAGGLVGEGPFRRDLMGWLLWKVMPPPVRVMRVKTSPDFMPGAEAPPAELRARFDALQEEQLECVGAADGLALDRIKIRSPFDGRVTYNLFSCLGILPRHQERHLWQAEQAAAELRAQAPTLTG